MVDPPIPPLPPEELAALRRRAREAREAAAAAAARYQALRERYDLQVRLRAERQNDERAARAQLRESIVSYVAILRRDNTPPERMLTLVKSAVGDAATDPLLRRQLLDEIVRWAVEAYYAA